jgi:hypothetical protein
MSVQLVCLFTTEQELDHIITMIEKTYDLVYKKIFVLSIEDSDELICSFNINKATHIKRMLPGAMIVHRRKETNTLFTVNSLNVLVKQENDGILDTNYAIDWTKYSNQFLIASNNELRQLKTKVYQIINI